MSDVSLWHRAQATTAGTGLFHIVRSCRLLAYMNDKGSPLNAYPAFWGSFSIIGEGAAR
jgi:hypothetical protein